MKKTLLFILLALFPIFLVAEKPSEEDAKAYQEALENYRSIYRELISKYIDDIYSGFHSIYRVADKENTLYSRSTEKDIVLYASLCALVYAKERSDFALINAEIEEGIKKLALDGHMLIGLLKRNLQTTPALSAILLYSPQKNHIILVFKGTVDKDNYDDWKKNISFLAYSGPDPLNALNAPDGVTKLSVHRGFGNAYLEGIDEFLPQFSKIVAQYKDQIVNNPLPLRVTVTGHSLGGALSLIAANDMPRIFRTAKLIDNPDRLIVENISFASPRVYDARSARIVENAMGGVHNILRFVDLADLVPSVPFTMLSADHAGIPFYFGKSVYTFSLASHAMTNYLAESPKTFTKIKKDAEYLRFVLDSIEHYKTLLDDKSEEPFEIYDRINNIKVAMQRNKVSRDFWIGALSDEKDSDKIQEIAKILGASDPYQAGLKEQLRKEEEKLKNIKAPPTKSWWWPFGSSGTAAQVK